MKEKRKEEREKGGKRERRKERKEEREKGGKRERRKTPTPL